jgi:hypothetical protein
MTLTNQQKAVIHVAKGQLHMADEDYRAMLMRIAGVTTSNDLDEDGFEKVMAEFERLGFRSVRSRTPASRREGMASPAQIGKIRSLWKAYSGNDDELRLGRWLEKHFHVSSLRFLEDWRAGKVIAILRGRMVPYAREKRARQAAQGREAN